MLFVALLPPGTPAKNLTTEPPPATGPYKIVNVEPGKGWSYVRNPQWAKSNDKAIPEVPSGHVDKIDISLVRNSATQVNEIERNQKNWMQTLVPADQYAKVKSKYEGSQFRVEHPISTYFFWLNTEEAPFDDVKLRQAVNYAVDSAALERIYAGSLAASHQILPEGMPGHETFDLYPHDMAKAKKLFAEANPSDRNITVWTDNESPNDKAGAYYAGVLDELGFNAKLKTINADNYFGIIGNLSTPDLDTGWAELAAGLPAPERLLPAAAGRRKHRPDLQHEHLADERSEAEREDRAGSAAKSSGPQQEEEYAQLDREFMEQAPMAPYGSITTSTFVDDEIDLEKVIYNPTMGQDLTSFQFK